MFMVLVSNLGKVFRLGSIFLHVFPASIAKQLRSDGSSLQVPHTHHGLHHGLDWVGAVAKYRGQTTLLHLLKAQGHDTVGEAASHQLLGQVEGRAAGGAVVVDIVDGDASHAQGVESSLAAGTVTVHIANTGLLYVSILDPGIIEGVGSSLLGHVGIVKVFSSARLLKLGHANTNDIHLAILCLVGGETS